MASSTQYIVYRFGSFALDLKLAALLAADGAEIPLRPKSFSLLRLLVESSGQLVSKEAIMDALWPNVFVTENNITQCIHEIRRALGSEADQILRTRPCRGYIFTSEVVQEQLDVAQAEPDHVMKLNSESRLYTAGLARPHSGRQPVYRDSASAAPYDSDATCFPTSSTDKADTSTIVPRTRMSGTTPRKNRGIGRPSGNPD